MIQIPTLRLASNYLGVRPLWGLEYILWLCNTPWTGTVILASSFWCFFRSCYYMLDRLFTWYSIRITAIEVFCLILKIIIPYSALSYIPKKKEKKKEGISLLSRPPNWTSNNISEFRSTVGVGSTNHRKSALTPVFPLDITCEDIQDSITFITHLVVHISGSNIKLAPIIYHNHSIKE